MAAVRRRSGGGIVVALVFFVVLAFVGIGGSIWFYQQLSLAKQTIAATEKAVDAHIKTVFDDAGWNLTTKTRAELGTIYDDESFQLVERKLTDAQMYETKVEPKLGTTPEELGTDIASAKIQATGGAIGAEPESLVYPTVAAVLARHNEVHDQLTREVARLTAQVTTLEGERDRAREDLRQAAAANQARINALTAEHTKNINYHNDHKVKTDAQLVQERAAKQAAIADVKAKEDERRTMEADYKDQIAEKDRRIKELWDLLHPTAPVKEEFKASGSVTAVESGFIVIGSGENHDVKVNGLFVVFSQTPDGTRTKKAVVRVGEVNPLTSVVYVVGDVEGEDPLVKGDLYTTVEMWDKFNEAE